MRKMVIHRNTRVDRMLSIAALAVSGLTVLGVILVVAVPRFFATDFKWCDGRAPRQPAIVLFERDCMRAYPLPSSSGEKSLVLDAARNLMVALDGDGLTSVNRVANKLLVSTPLASSTGGLGLPNNASANTFYGIDAQSDLQEYYESGAIVVRSTPHQVATVLISSTSNVDSAVGLAMYSRVYTVSGYEYGEFAGGIELVATNPDTNTLLELQFGPMPLTSDMWFGPGSAACSFKELSSGSAAILVPAGTFFAKDNGAPFLQLHPPLSAGSGAPIGCTFEFKYKVPI